MIEIVAIGDEVLHGYTLNRNASFISKFLSEAGYLVSYHHVVGDDKARVESLLQEALLRGSFVIVTGGLGPTLDDHTRAILADFFKTALLFREELFQKLKARFGDLPALRDQATVPASARLLENMLGSASGLVMRDEERFPRATVVALPGVPQEMRSIVRQDLKGLVEEAGIKRKTGVVEVLHFIHLWESTVDPLLRVLQAEYPAVQFGIYPGFEVLTVHLKGKNSEEIEEPKKRILAEWGHFLYECESGDLQEALHLHLLKTNLKLATAESCTGGMLAARLVTQAGASHYFQGSVVAYTNEVKRKLLGVKIGTLEKYGAVSREVTEEMALGASHVLQANCTVAVSGIFGPTGGTAEKPVGTVAATIFLEGHPPHSWLMHHSGNREVILEKVVNEVFAKLLFFLRNNMRV